MILYSYFRSSAAYRVRIALNIKGIDYQLAPVNLLEGAHQSDEYRAINPLGLVPALRLEDGTVLTQSTAILEWLEETHPDKPLLPRDPLAKARVRAWVNTIACDIHPIDNLRVLKYLTGTLGVDEEQKTAWYQHWIRPGFEALEKQLTAGPYCAGEAPGMADCYLVPQVYNARRFGLDMSPYPKIQAGCAACDELDAFIAARPENQPDAPGPV